MDSSLNKKIDEDEWIIQIRETVDKEPEDNQKPVSIFSVPKILMVSDRDCYVPQQVGIGPYHHWKPELFEMDRHKLDSARRTRKQLQLQNLKFQHLVDQLAVFDFESKIRAHYDKYLDLKGETLAWMMAKDASFLLDFLRDQAAKEGRVSSANNAILRDMVMLENQIPLFLLREVLKLQFSSLKVADDMLMSMLTWFCKQLLPFKMMEKLPKVQVKNCAHLLDFLYQVIMLEWQVRSETPESDEGGEIKEASENHFGKSSQTTEIEGGGGTKEDGENHFGKSSHVKKLLHVVWNVLLKLNKAPVSLIKKILFSKLLKVILKLPWTAISNLPGLRRMKAPIESLFLIELNEAQNQENETSNALIQEITIPSVIELSKAGVKFSPTKEGIQGIKFVNKTATFYLPSIRLDINTEVVLRNLVAYEACKESVQSVFARYTELMNGITDTEEDAKLLRDEGIILNHLKSDEEVANLWNGMTKSIKLTKVQRLDKVIEDVNKYYDGRWRVKIGKFFKVYVLGSWQFITFMAAILLLLLMTLQAFCSVYSCARIFHIELPPEKFL